MDKKAKILTTANIILVLAAAYKVYYNDVKSIDSPIYYYILVAAIILLAIRAKYIHKNK